MADSTRFAVEVLIEFFNEKAALANLAWLRFPHPRTVSWNSPITLQAVIYVEKPEITRASLEWKAAKTQETWDEARAMVLGGNP